MNLSAAQILGSKQPVSCVHARKQRLSAPDSPRIATERIRGRAAPIRSESRTSTCAPATLLQAGGGCPASLDLAGFSPAEKIGAVRSATRGESTYGPPTLTSPSHGPGRAPDYEVAIVFRNDNAGRVPPRTVHKRVLRHRHRDCRQLREGGTPGLGLLDGRPPDAAHLRRADGARIRAPTKEQFSQFSARTAISLWEKNAVNPDNKKPPEGGCYIWSRGQGLSLQPPGYE